MIDRGKKCVLGIKVDAVDYEGAVNRIEAAAKAQQAFTVSALAVHGLMTGVQSDQHKFRLNAFDLIVPDGQPVMWALNLLHHTALSSRVYGPELTIRTLEMAAREDLPVYFYGSTPEVLCDLLDRAQKMLPRLRVAGFEPSQFRSLSPRECDELGKRVEDSGARILFVGLGCPRQEIFAYEMRTRFPMPVLAVGAAFAFISGRLSQAPSWLGPLGLEWAYRLHKEPRRLWRRYMFLNPYYVLLLLRQWL